MINITIIKNPALSERGFVFTVIQLKVLFEKVGMKFTLAFLINICF